jgi:tetratricopeptide (TPR) repeat protein
VLLDRGKALNAHLLTILVGLFYILIIGVIAMLRREGLSAQLALEALAFVAVFVLIGWLTGVTIDPIILFVLLYLITMRARLLTDLANLAFRRWGYGAAQPWYRLALNLFPDRTARYVVLVNWGIARMESGNVEEAINTFESILASADEGGGLGDKYEAACRYNLGVAYRRAERNTQAVLQFNRVTELFPASVYGQAAERALKRGRERDSTPKES